MSETHVIPVYSYQRRKALYFIERLPDKITLEMVEIPAGKFVMGVPQEFWI